MGDLYSDDIEDHRYADEQILADIRALIKTGQREGTVLEYKSDISEKDNWPQTIAAFCNTFGGLVIFGVEGKDDQPRRLSGFDPGGIEVRTKLTSMILDRVQPRPEGLSARVVTFDDDKTKEIALVRVAEGHFPPYMHSFRNERRIYVRVGAQKAEADYVQLMGLLDKRKKSGARDFVSMDEFQGAQSKLHAMSGAGPATSAEFYRFYPCP